MVSPGCEALMAAWIDPPGCTWRTVANAGDARARTPTAAAATAETRSALRMVPLSSVSDRTLGGHVQRVKLPRAMRAAARDPCDPRGAVLPVLPARPCPQPLLGRPVEAERGEPLGH